MADPVELVPRERHVPVVVVGGGQAGLSISWCLTHHGIEHVVLERDGIGSEWARRRWDSFCLVTPNRQCCLPGRPYAGDDPDGFMLRDEIVAFLEAYAASFDPPVRIGVTVNLVTRRGEGFSVQTTDGDLTADHVVVCTGGYHAATVPRVAERVPDGVVQLHSSEYRAPDALPDGATLVVGTGQSGCQIAEDLHLAGRSVHLACGSAPRVARRYRGKDCMTWLYETGHYTLPVDEHPDGEANRHKTNHYVTGRDGGRDIDLRQFAAEGMGLHGRLLTIEDGVASFADDLAANLDGADRSAESIKDVIDAWIAEQGLDAPPEERRPPVWEPPADLPRTLDLQEAGITSVVWSMGYRADYGWIDVPAFTGRGYPTHDRGVSTVPGLSFLGLPWLHTWGSGRFLGIAQDAEHVGDHIARALGVDAAPLAAAGRA